MLYRVNGIYTEWEDSNFLLYQGNLFTGIQYYLYPNGQIQKERSYFEGRETGFDRSWYSNENLRSEIPKFGSSHVITFFKKWHSNGQLSEEGFMEYGVVFKKKIWDEKGILTKDWKLEENEAEPMYRYLQMLRKDHREYSPEFLHFEKEIEEYLVAYPSNRAYYERDFEKS
jgi:hypothetical protein